MRRYLILFLSLLVAEGFSQVGELGKKYTWNEFTRTKDVYWTGTSDTYVTNLINTWIINNLESVQDTFYIDYGCDHGSPGWKYSGDTLYIDTCFASSGGADTLYVTYECDPDLASGMRINGDTIWVDTCYADDSYWDLINRHLIPADEVDSVWMPITRTDTIFSFSDDSIYYENYTYDTLTGLVNTRYSMASPAYFYLEGNWEGSTAPDTGWCVTATVWCFDDRTGDTTFNSGWDYGGIDSIIYDPINDWSAFYFSGAYAGCELPGLVICSGGGGQYKGYSDVYFQVPVGEDVYVPVTINDSLNVTGNTELDNDLYIGSQTYAPWITMDQPVGYVIGWDSITGEHIAVKPNSIVGIENYWTLYEGEPADTLKNNVATNGIVRIVGDMTIDGEVYMPGIPITPILSGHESFVMRLDTATHRVHATSMQEFTDTLNNYMPNYWTFVEVAGIDTLYNNTPSEDSAGVIFLKHDVFTDRWLKRADNTIFGVGAGNQFVHVASTTGWANNLFGNRSGEDMTTGFNNIGFGYETLANCTEGSNNIAIGNGSLASITTYAGNIGIGVSALNAATSSTVSIAIGNSSMALAQGVDCSVAVGGRSLERNVTGDENVAIGYSSMFGQTSQSQSYNTAIGCYSMYNISTTGNENTAVGHSSLYSSRANMGSTAVGFKAMYYADSRATGRLTYNTAIGYQSMYGTTTAANNTGRYNTAIGYNSLYGFKDGNSNNAHGYNALVGNSSGDYNQAFGVSALQTNTTGDNNIAVGHNAMYYNSTGSDNVAVGGNALQYSTAVSGGNVGIGNAAGQDITGTYNVAIGMNSLKNTKTGVENVSIGYGAMGGATSGAGVADYNIAIGTMALYSDSSGNYNTCIGYRSAYLNDEGFENVGIGSYTLYDNTEGYYNVGIGTYSLQNSTIGFSNIGIGTASLGAMIDGNSNIAIGSSTLSSNTEGYGNVAVGGGSGASNIVGDSNVFIGVNAGNTNLGSSNIFIGFAAGKNETGSDKFYVDNTDTSTPLLWGDLNLDSLRFHADVAFVHDLWYEDTLWLDAATSGMSLAPGANAPSLRTLVGGIKQYGFAGTGQNDQEYGQAQINHDYMLGQDLHAHFHWALETTPNAGDTIVFSLEYSWADINETFTSDTLKIKIGLDGLSATKHYITEFGDITGPGGDNVSSVIPFSITRLQDDPDDTGYDGASDYVFVLDVDFHKPINSPGSRTEYIK